MAVSNCICPLCRYEAAQAMFENVDGHKLKCRRCRGKFDDPNAYGADATYADCDSQRVVTKFPFSLKGKNVSIRVREGYLALLIGNDGSKLWLSARENAMTAVPEGVLLYYVCLTPWLSWGSGGLKEFGCYGKAQLSITKEFIEEFCGVDGRIQSLEWHLKSLVDGHITKYVQSEIDRHNTAVLEHREGYLNAVGPVAEGVSLLKIDPMGYRNESGRVGAFPVLTFAAQAPQPEIDETVFLAKPPAEIAKPLKKSYTIKDGVEEVFVRGTSKADRHKAGEIIESNTLNDVSKALRFHAKEFDFPYGWGVYNQPCNALGYFSAHGDLSFYIDSTQRLGLLLAKTSSWEVFAEQFFNDVFKKELSVALREIMDAYVGKGGFEPGRIKEYLSAMSVELVNLLNGESVPPREPAFRKYGLRVNKADILDICFYAARR